MISVSLYSIHEPHTHVEDDKVKGASNRGVGGVQGDQGEAAGGAGSGARAL